MNFRHSVRAGLSFGLVALVAVAVLGTGREASATRSSPHSEPQSSHEGHFPDAVTLREQFDAGQRSGSYRPTDADLVPMQETIDLLNDLWIEARSKQHAIMRETTRLRILDGTLEPVSDDVSTRRAGALGGSIQWRDGELYRLEFFPGEHAQVDAMEMQLDILHDLGTEVIQAWFE